MTKTLYDVLHWAMDSKVINEHQRDLLITEFSKRYNKLVPSSSYYEPLPADDD
jgi:hypothetical protein